MCQCYCLQMILFCNLQNALLHFFQNKFAKMTEICKINIENNLYSETCVLIRIICCLCACTYFLIKYQVCFDLMKIMSVVLLLKAIMKLLVCQILMSVLFIYLLHSVFYIIITFIIFFSGSSFNLIIYTHWFYFLNS